MIELLGHCHRFEDRHEGQPEVRSGFRTWKATSTVSSASQPAAGSSATQLPLSGVAKLGNERFYFSLSKKPALTEPESSGTHSKTAGGQVGLALRESGVRSGSSQWWPQATDMPSRPSLW